MEGSGMGLNKTGIDTKDLSFTGRQRYRIGRESPVNRVERMFDRTYVRFGHDFVEFHQIDLHSCNLRFQ